MWMRTRLGLIIRSLGAFPLLASVDSLFGEEAKIPRDWEHLDREAFLLRLAEASRTRMEGDA
jgi:hypothetical protein